MLTPHNITWDTMIYQEWMHGFNLELTQGLKTHVVTNTKQPILHGFITKTKTKTGLVPNSDHETRQIRTRT